MVLDSIYDLIDRGDLNATRSLLKSNFGSVNFNDLLRGYSPLHLAAWKGDVPLVALLIQHGADVNFCSIYPSKLSPLEFCYQYKPFMSLLSRHPLTSAENKFKCAKILSAAGASLNEEKLGYWLFKLLQKDLQMDTMRTEPLK